MWQAGQLFVRGSASQFSYSSWLLPGKWISNVSFRTFTKWKHVQSPIWYDLFSITDLE